jgi:curved DNA-binding protein CbpA
VASAVSDPFAVLGVDRTLDLDARTLESLWIRRSREVHPDHLGDLTADEQVDALARAAQLNDAYRALSDRWRRAEALCEILDPGVLDRTKALPPDFLMDAMENAEAVADCDPDSEAARDLEQRLVHTCDGWFETIRAAVAADDVTEAATSLHKSRYDRKALADLRARRQA